MDYSPDRHDDYETDDKQTEYKQSCRNLVWNGLNQLQLAKFHLTQLDIHIHICFFHLDWCCWAGLILLVVIPSLIRIRSKVLNNTFVIILKHP